MKWIELNMEVLEFYWTGWTGWTGWTEWVYFKEWRMTAPISDKNWTSIWCTWDSVKEVWGKTWENYLNRVLLIQPFQAFQGILMDTESWDVTNFIGGLLNTVRVSLYMLDTVRVGLYMVDTVRVGLYMLETVRIGFCWIQLG